jgi:hypothetical protein
VTDRTERTPTFAADITSRLVTRRKFASMTNLSERSVDRRIANGTFPVLRFDQTVLIDVESAKAALAASK